MGERLNGIQEVSGSIPLFSTKRPETAMVSGLFLAFLHIKVLTFCQDSGQYKFANSKFNLHMLFHNQ